MKKADKVVWWISILILLALAAYAVWREPVTMKYLMGGR